jgi:hypothetical protein
MRYGVCLRGRAAGANGIGGGQNSGPVGSIDRNALGKSSGPRHAFGLACSHDWMCSGSLSASVALSEGVLLVVHLLHSCLYYTRPDGSVIAA